MWQPEDHQSLFTAAEGWGLFSQKREGNTQTERIEVRAGRLPVKRLVFEAPERRAVERVAVKANGRAVESTRSLDGQRVTITLASEVTVTQGQAIKVELR